MDGDRGRFSGIGGGREAGRQLDSLALERTETRQREGHGVRTRPQVEQLVVALVIRDHDANFFDQRRTGRLNCDTREHCTCRVLYNTGDASAGGVLRRRIRRTTREQEQQTGNSSMRHESPKDFAPEKSLLRAAA